ncbi:MAG: hypothetical protein ABII22_03675 [Candidatus Micrarchaeota archaeon]
MKRTTRYKSGKDFILERYNNIFLVDFRAQKKGFGVLPMAEPAQGKLLKLRRLSQLSHRVGEKMLPIVTALVVSVPLFTYFFTACDPVQAPAQTQQIEQTQTDKIRIGNRAFFPEIGTSIRVTGTMGEEYVGYIYEGSLGTIRGAAKFGHYVILKDNTDRIMFERTDDPNVVKATIFTE